MSNCECTNTVADPETSERRAARNMKHKPLRLVAISFMNIFYRPGGGDGPLGSPLDPLLQYVILYKVYTAVL